MPTILSPSLTPTVRERRPSPGGYCASAIWYQTKQAARSPLAGEAVRRIDLIFAADSGE
jgi:hypothetical protein